MERAPGSVALVSRLATRRVLAVIGGALVALALAVAGSLPALALALAAAAALLAALGGRPVRARIERGRVRVRPAVPFERTHERRLEEFAAARIETVADERRRKSERIAQGYRARTGAELPSWIRRPDAPGTNDHLRRIVLVARDGEPLPVTAWLADDDLEPARSELEALLAARA